MSKIQEQLKALELQEKKLLNQLDTQRSNKQFRCGCGKMHRIKNCVAIQTHYYVQPSGCTDGDYWLEGEIQIVCPDTDSKNRMFFNNYDVDWDKQGDYKYNAQKQFRNKYLKLFKEVIQDYKQDKRTWWNNYYIDKHHEKFDLCVEGRDYKTWKVNSIS